MRAFLVCKAITHMSTAKSAVSQYANGPANSSVHGTNQPKSNSAG